MENNSFKVIVAGGRDFFNYELVKQKLDILLSKKENVVILSAMETGADSLGVRYAREHKLLISWFPATPVKHGSRTGSSGMKKCLCMPTPVSASGTANPREHNT